MLQVYYADIHELPLDSGGYLLSAYRREQLQRIHHPLRRQQAIGAELLLIRALSEYDPAFRPPARIVSGSQGKPYLMDSPLFFSISHSGNYSACVVAEVEAGLDLQVPRAYSESVAKRCFTAREQAILSGCTDRDYAFTMLWSLKESCLKARGTGLRTPMHTISVRFAPDSETASCENASLWHGVRDGCHFALCRIDGQTLDRVELNRVDLP